MAEDQLAPAAGRKAHWTKIFTAFRVALDLKKLLLAAGGIVATAVGWLVFALIFYSDRVPQWKDYTPTDKTQSKDEAWSAFQRDRKRWNVLHEMAGPTPDTLAAPIKYDAGDVANSVEEYEALLEVKKLHDEGKTELIEKDKATKLVALYRDRLAAPATKPVGRLRSWPWTDERGPNPYLLVDGMLRKDAEGHRTVPWEAGKFLGWLVSDQLPVLVEPLMKFLAPIGYFFNSDAGGFRIRVYLILVILWTLLVWGFFGGAICRIAAVQIARNEKIPLREAVDFAKEKFLNLFTAPLFPLIFLGVLTFFLAAFGLIAGYTHFFGDVVLSGLLYPVVIVLGLIMAVVVVGLVGWPLMNPTIAVEGSDNFDALSRSYSYVYQAFWHYLGYWALALVYGAALIFFIGFMGSLVIYMGKWGLSRALGLQGDVKNDRDPAYLFTYAPTSFGWRDLLIKDNPHVEVRERVTAGGFRVETYEFKKEYLESYGIHNKIGAIMVGFWVGLFFLLVVGFGYSYFWTASTIIYFLMRQHVDDTELEEVFIEEEDLEPPGAAAAPSAPPAAAAPKPNTLSLNVVESPAAPMPVAAPTMPTAAPLPATPPPPANPPGAAPSA